MMENITIDKVLLYEILETSNRYCSSCDMEHELYKVKFTDSSIILGEEIEHDALSYLCPETSETFISMDMMEHNLREARDAYRTKHNLLTSKEIVQIRSRAGYTQEEFSLKLGFRRDRIDLLEKKAIQTIREDKIIRHYYISFCNLIN